MDQKLTSASCWDALSPKEKRRGIAIGVAVALTTIAVGCVVAVPVVGVAALVSLPTMIVIGVCRFYAKRIVIRRYAQADRMPVSAWSAPLTEPTIKVDTPFMPELAAEPDALPVEVSVEAPPVVVEHRRAATQRRLANANPTSQKPTRKAAPIPEPESDDDDDQRYLGPVIGSASDGEQLIFEYVDAHGEITQRILFDWKEHRKYFTGYCQMSDGNRTFRKDRVLEWHHDSDLYLKRP